MARLQFDLRPLTERLGQRVGFQPQHAGFTFITAVSALGGFDTDVHGSIDALGHQHPEVAEWTRAAADAVGSSLQSLPADGLPTTLVHGDFAPWNVHCQGSRLVGVIDFALSHVDSRPFELAIARSAGAPLVRVGYREELSRLAWPLTELEVAAIDPIDCAFWLEHAVEQIGRGASESGYDLDAITSHLERTGVSPP